MFHVCFCFFCFFLCKILDTHFAETYHIKKDKSQEKEDRNIAVSRIHEIATSAENSVYLITMKQR